MVALFDAPNLIGVERQRDKDSAAGFGNNGFEMLCRQDDPVAPISQPASFFHWRSFHRSAQMILQSSITRNKELA
jgi:hypothetical protein